MPTVLIGACTLRNQPGTFRDLLLEHGFECIDPEWPDEMTVDQYRSVLPGANAVLAGSELLTDDMMAEAPRLRVVARVGVGYDSIDIEAATRRGIAVTITPGTNHDSVAEHAFALLLALTRRIAWNDRIIREGGWDRTIVQPLRGKTLGLVGLGRIGRAMVPRARAFGMAVVAFDPVSDTAFDRQHDVTRVELDELVAQADVVSLHLPLTPATRKMFNRDVFRRMRPGALLINTARGGLVDESDLAESLASGHLGGAGLDVLDPEPPDAGNPLLKLPNVVVSPHVAGIDRRGLDDMAEKAARTIIALEQGDWPADCIVNPVLGPDWRW